MLRGEDGLCAGVPAGTGIPACFMYPGITARPTHSSPCSPQSISTLICDKLSLALAKLWSFIPAATNCRVAHAGEQL